MAASDDDVFHVGSPPSPSSRVVLEERSNREFIRRLANDYIHFKIHGRSDSPNMDMLRDLGSDAPLGRFQSSTSSYDDRTSVFSDNNNNSVVQSPTLHEAPLQEANGVENGSGEENVRKPFRKASRVLRKVSVELERTNSNFFESVCDDLNLSHNDAQVTFKHVSERVLNRDSLNWGRVVSLFTFGGKLAEWFWNTHQEDKIEEVEEWLAESLSSKESWIEENGGWVSLLFVIFLSTSRQAEKVGGGEDLLTLATYLVCRRKKCGIKVVRK